LGQRKTHSPNHHSIPPECPQGTLCGNPPRHGMGAKNHPTPCQGSKRKVRPEMRQAKTPPAIFLTSKKPSVVAKPTRLPLLWPPLYPPRMPPGGTLWKSAPSRGGSKKPSHPVPGRTWNTIRQSASPGYSPSAPLQVFRSWLVQPASLQKPPNSPTKTTQQPSAP